MNKIVETPTFLYTWDEIGMTRDEYLALDEDARQEVLDGLRSRLFIDIFGMDSYPSSQQEDVLV